MYSTGMTPLKGDQLILEELNKLLGFASRKYVMLAPWRSSVKESGITLTLAGARWWNERHKADWYEYFDLFFPRMDPEAYEGEQAVAIHSDTYRVRDEADPGPDEAPNMKEKKLPGKMTFMLYMPQVVSFCEAKRQVGIMGTRAATNNGVDPKKFGVKFDETLGMCKLTQRYCSRFGADYHASKHFGAGECEVGAGQEFAEHLRRDHRQGRLAAHRPLRGVHRPRTKVQGGHQVPHLRRQGRRPGATKATRAPTAPTPSSPSTATTPASTTAASERSRRRTRSRARPSPPTPGPTAGTRAAADYSITAKDIGNFCRRRSLRVRRVQELSDAKNRVDYDNELRKKDPFGKECDVPNNDGLTPGHQRCRPPARHGRAGKKCWTKPHDDRVMYRRPYAELKEPSWRTTARPKCA